MMSDNSNLPDFMLEQLHKIAKAGGFSEYRFEQTVGSKHGDGFLSAMLNVTVTGQRNVDGIVKPDQLVLICKLLPENLERRQMFSSAVVFEREVEMYNRVLPLFARLQAENGLAEAHGFFEYPHCYYAIADDVQDRYLIIMDDLRVAGYSLWDKTVPVEYEKARLLMTVLARFHACSFAVRDQRPDEFTTFDAMEDVLLHMTHKAPGLSAMINASIDSAVRLLSGQPEVKFLTELKSTWKDDLLALLSEGKSERFSVIVHGDSWLNNFMFKSKENETEKICVLDWQVCRLMSPALDLSFFFLSSTTKAFRDKHMHDLLDIYYAQLAATLRAFGSDPEKLLTLSQLQDQLQRYGRFGAIMAPMFISVVISKPENLNSMDTMTGDKPKEIACFDDVSAAVYVERLTDAINDAKAYGWID